MEEAPDFFFVRARTPRSTACATVANLHLVNEGDEYVAKVRRHVDEGVLPLTAVEQLHCWIQIDVNGAKWPHVLLVGCTSDPVLVVSAGIEGTLRAERIERFVTLSIEPMPPLPPTITLPRYVALFVASGIKIDIPFRCDKHELSRL